MAPDTASVYDTVPHHDAVYDQRLTVLEPLLTIAETARLFKRDRSTVYRWIRSGHVTPVRVGGHWMFEPNELRFFIAKHRREPRIGSRRAALGGGDANRGERGA
jgi:excisionase family DNA binding protein